MTPSRIPPDIKRALPSLVLVMAVLVTFAPVLTNGFVWDDIIMISENPNVKGFDGSHIKWVLTTFYDGNYHPIYWMTLGIDHLLWGGAPSGYHFTSLAWHALNAVLFFYMTLALLGTVRPGSARAPSEALVSGALIGALFFALHPLRVETVAWLSARGDLLCAAFLMISIIGYLKMVAAENIVHRWLWYLAVLASAVFSALCRAWTITLPVVLIILDVYPLARYRRRNAQGAGATTLLLEKLPLVLLSLITAYLAILAKSGSMKASADHTLPERLMQAAYGLLFYPVKTIVPVNLSPLYLLDHGFDAFAPLYVLSTIVVIVGTILLLRNRRRWPWALCVWCVYGVMISPQLGLVQSGPQLTADRYSYIATMPFFVLIGAGMSAALDHWRRRPFPRPHLIAIRLGLLFTLLSAAAASYTQTWVWESDYTLWSHAAAHDSGNYVAYNNLGNYLKDNTRRYQAAMDCYDRAIQLNPNLSEAYYNRALLKEIIGDTQGAITDYTDVIKRDKGDDRPLNNRGLLKQAEGDLNSAIEDFNGAIAVNPNAYNAYANRGLVHTLRGQPALARRDFRTALETAPDKWPQRALVEKMIANLED
jgi:tetratricopeptide (TPR) repeat protein